jgi:endonuclease/exonuclease/phosphatase family metal-dependent hydrolase/2'-5' RNA ligase/uncharacterized protein (UPF0248 family)
VFPTEREIYHRLRWDPRFDPRRCHIVFTLRPTGTKRVPFLDHDLDAVPWHRIIEYWIDDELAWSRPERIDRLDELATARGAPVSLPPVAAIEPHAFVDGAWRPARLVAPPPRDVVRAITWNLLFDRFDAEILQSDVRWQDALDRIGAADADIVALCEITPAMWQRVLAQSWVRTRAVSHAPDTPHLAPFGQVIISRYPLRDAHMLELARRRAAVAATLELGDRAAGVVAIHLTSDKTDDAAVLRPAQLAGVLAHVQANRRDAWIVAGDFNASPDELAVPIGVDAWQATRPDEPGHTFDVATNSLAAAVSSTGRSSRLDRVVALGLQPTATRLIGVEPGPTGHPPSDHYGVVAELAIGAPPDLRTAPTTKRLALVIVPPVDAWYPIQRVRCEHDRGFGRWPPHITLAHPFVDDAWLDRAVAAVRRLAAGTPSFDLVFDDIAPIETGSRTIVMVPDRRSARILEHLHAAIREVIPIERDRYLPHLTIARDVDARTIRPFAMRMRVDYLTVLREIDDRFEVAHEIPFAGAEVRLPPACDRRHDAVIEKLRAAAELVDPTAAVSPFGSVIYAPSLARDIDVVVEIDQPVDAFAGELASILEVAPTGSPAHLRGRLDDTTVELAISCRAVPDEQLLAGPRDGAALLQHLRDHGCHDAFLTALPEVRRFAHARALVGNGLGYLGSFGWSMLLAIPLCHDCSISPWHDVFAEWLAWLAKLSPNTRLGFDAPPSPDPAPLWIAAPAPPARTAARGLTPGTFAVLRDEVRRARSGFVDIDDDPPPGHHLVVTGTPANRGAYEGRFRAMLGALEAALGPVVRPYGRIDAGWRHHVVVPLDAASQAREILAGELATLDPPPQLAGQSGQNN